MFCVVCVQAQFQQKGDYNPNLKRKKKKKKKAGQEKCVLSYVVDNMSHVLSKSVPLLVLSLSFSLPPLHRLLDWRERRMDGPKRMKNERIIVFKHLFDPKEFEVKHYSYTHIILSSDRSTR